MSDPWQVRAAARNAERTTAALVRSDEDARADYRARVEADRLEHLGREPAPPNGCFMCYEQRQHPSFGIWDWWHLWPESQPFEDWVCHHACHGPGGCEQQAIAFA